MPTESERRRQPDSGRGIIAYGVREKGPNGQQRRNLRKRSPREGIKRSAVTEFTQESEWGDHSDTDHGVEQIIISLGQELYILSKILIWYFI